MKKISIKILKEQKEVKGNPEAPKVLIVGDSIAAGMVVVAHKEGIVNQPQCKGKYYFSCVTEVAKGGTYSSWALKKVRKYFASPGNSRPANDKGTMILSTGTNDALDVVHHTRKGTKSRMKPAWTAENINRIVEIARANGYKVKFKLLGPFFPRGKTSAESLKVFNNYAKELAKRVSASPFDGQLTKGDMRDKIHPSDTGSMRLLEDAGVTNLEDIYDPYSPDYESGADDPK